MNRNNNYLWSLFIKLSTNGHLYVYPHDQQSDNRNKGNNRNKENNRLKNNNREGEQKCWIIYPYCRHCKAEKGFHPQNTTALNEILEKNKSFEKRMADSGAKLPEHSKVEISFLRT